MEERKGIWEKNSHGEKRRETKLGNLVKDNHRREEGRKQEGGEILETSTAFS